MWPLCLQLLENTYPQPHFEKNAVVLKFAGSLPNDTAIPGVAMILAKSKAQAFNLASYNLESLK